jgi:hypothetical protein
LDTLSLHDALPIWALFFFNQIRVKLPSKTVVHLPITKSIKLNYMRQTNPKAVPF